MADTLKVLGLCGSLREGLFNRAALDFAVENAPDAMTIETWSRLGELPPYNEDVREKGFPPAVEDLRRRLKEADGLLIVTPEYNYSVPGVLKNAIDWASRPPEQPFKGKPIALMSASVSLFGGARAHYHLRQSFVFLDGLVMNVPEVMIASAKERFEGGKLTHEPTRTFISGDFLPAFADWIRARLG